MSSPKSLRLDQLLVERGLAQSRSLARSLIMSGAVLVNGEVKDKAGTPVRHDAAVELKEKPRYVSRGGLKLEAGLDGFGVDPSGLTCLDAGASTGGFTDCLLQRGAAKVYAADVGKGQLDWRLRNDGRVIVLEGVNARNLDREIIPEEVSLAVADVSFISLTLVLPAITSLLGETGNIIALVKPQFEAGREKVGKGGVVRDPEIIRQCVDDVSSFAATIGLAEAGRLPSPIKGPKGNQEWLIHLILD